MRTLVLVLGDQLSHASPAWSGFDAAADAVLMIEAPGEATHVWSHKARIAIFLAAMRHFRDELREGGRIVHYVELDAEGAPVGFGERLARALHALQPQRLRLVEAGEWRLEQLIADTARAASIDLEMLSDSHFLCTRAEFSRWAGPPSRRLRMEDFYRAQRVKLGLLVDAQGRPEGGRWNFDADNRKAWPKTPRSRAGPGLVAAPEFFPPDATTRAVIELVEHRFAEHPGALADFSWPVCRADAVRALEVFIESRLPSFGTYQDAMWSGTPFGWHSLLSSCLNLHLLDPREVVASAEAAYRRGDAPLAGVEGFVRQIVGWREFIRGNYWRDMPAMAEANHLGAERPLPAWYWSGKTRMACAREVVEQTMRFGYAHHIQRLMVTGQFALLAGITPKQVADWYLAVYIDAVEWAELPNVAGMALWADGGRFTTKPYIASGAYIDRMSDYCGRCAYAPSESEAERRGKPLCPFTVLYWNFVATHGAALRDEPRLVHAREQLARRSEPERRRLADAASALLADLDGL